MTRPLVMDITNTDKGGGGRAVGPKATSDGGLNVSTKVPWSDNQRFTRWSYWDLDTI